MAVDQLKLDGESGRGLPCLTRRLVQGSFVTDIRDIEGETKSASNMVLVGTRTVTGERSSCDNSAWLRSPPPPPIQQEKNRHKQVLVY
jgi:hypothetical protein